MPMLPTVPWAMEEPPLPLPQEILVTGFDGAPGPDSAPAGVATATAPAEPGVTPDGEAPVAPTLDPPVDDAFPSLAALDAIRAAFAEDQPGPDQVARAELAALLGLDPTLAVAEAAFMDALRDAPAPDGDALRAEWLSEAAADVPPPWRVLPQDWPLG